MMFSSREFEKRIRSLHRTELEQSPELLREFKRKRKAESAARSRLGRNVLMPVFWTAIFFAMIHRRDDVAWAAGIIALWSAGTALKWGHYWFQQFYASEDLVVLNLLPLNDRQIFKFQLRRYFSGAGWVTWELLLGYLVLAFLPGEKGPAVRALVIAALAQTFLVLALALHAASYLHMLPMGTLAGLLRMTAIVLLVLGVQEVEFTPALVRATEWFLPTGWINYMLLQSTRDMAVLVLGIPIAAIIYLSRYSFERLRSFYSLEGFEIVPGPAHAPTSDHEELTPASFGSRAGPTEIEDRIASRYFLEGVNWDLRGGMERLVGRLLNPRERVITEFLVAQDPGWTRSLKWSFWVWLTVSLLAMAFGRSFGTIVFFGAYVLAAATLPLFAGEWRGMRQAAAGGMFMPGYSLYPIAFNEMARIFLKVNLTRLVAASPLIVSFAAIGAYQLGHPALAGAIIGLKFLGLLICLQPLLVLLPISSTTNDASRMVPLWLFVFVPLILVILAAGIGVFLSDTALGVLTSFVLLLLLSGMLFFIYRKAYRSGRFDLLNPRSRS
ncbi:MAG: hypothetical protein ACXW32_01755, partial [Limisphaerales bacterium]